VSGRVLGPVLGLALGLLLGGCAPARAAVAPVEIDALTSPELRARIVAGTHTVLLPIGGTEQSGAHLVLGKHNQRVALMARRIAERLGDAVVAPVLAYVPEGDVSPPTSHMRWAGTISVPPAAFEALLEGAAASLCHHGLNDVVLLGDHGGYQKLLEAVAARATARQGSPCRVWALTEYYDAMQSGFDKLLAARGFGAAEIGTHAGLADTSLALAVDRALVRPALQAQGHSDGVNGDPRRATAELGELGLAQAVDASVDAIERRRRR
jgi:creatinine amidohydrolase/Fe(II)-dependent formamide hydrolase-like protein